MKLEWPDLVIVLCSCWDHVCEMEVTQTKGSSEALSEGAPLRFTTRLLDFDQKRIHYFHEMHHAEEGYLAATNEILSLHVSGETRRSAPMSSGIQNRLAQVFEDHRSSPPPPQAGRRIGLEKKPT